MSIATPAARDRAVARLARLDTQIGRLSAEHATIAADVAAYDAANGPWETMSKAHAVLRVLAESKSALSPAEIEVLLADRGRADISAMDTSAILNRFRKVDRVQRVAYGRWVLSEKG